MPAVIEDEYEKRLQDQQKKERRTVLNTEAGVKDTIKKVIQSRRMEKVEKMQELSIDPNEVFYGDSEYGVRAGKVAAFLFIQLFRMNNKSQERTPDLCEKCAQLVKNDPDTTPSRTRCDSGYDTDNEDSNTTRSRHPAGGASVNGDDLNLNDLDDFELEEPASQSENSNISVQVKSTEEGENIPLDLDEMRKEEGFPGQENNSGVAG